MSISTTSRARGIINRLTQSWSEFDYAQRRLLETRTGVQVTRPEPIPTGTDELETLYELNSPRKSVAKHHAIPDSARNCR